VCVRVCVCVDGVIHQMVSMNDVQKHHQGVSLLEQSVECIYVRVEAVKALNMIYLELNQKFPDRAGVYLEVPPAFGPLNSHVRWRADTRAPEKKTRLALEACARVSRDAANSAQPAHVLFDTSTVLRRTHKAQRVSSPSP